MTSSMRFARRRKIGYLGVGRHEKLLSDLLIKRISSPYTFWLAVTSR